MDLKEMVNIQREFDRIHGWIWEGGNVCDLLDLINKDLIGLIGEIGEFANIIKKINLIAERKNSEQLATKLEDSREILAEELIDSLIYLMRIATHLEVDLQTIYLKKVRFNKERYREYEISDQK